MIYLSEDERDWLAALAFLGEAGAGAIATQAGHGRGASQAFGHFARKHPELLKSRRQERPVTVVYRLTPEGAEKAGTK